MNELSPEAIQILIGMRKKLQQGWIQGKAKDEFGNVCLLGALGALTDNYSGFREVKEVAYALCEHIILSNCYIKLRLGNNLNVLGNRLAVWNDFHGRTQEEVLRLIDDVLAKVRK
jgi:hypothetical protein